MPVAPLPLADLAAARAVFAELGAAAQAQGVPLRKPPPEPTSCCGRGCNGCVWEGYFTAANTWREDALAALRDALAPEFVSQPQRGVMQLNSSQ